MSGVSKDRSYVLTFGKAGQCKVESFACKFFSSFSGPQLKSKFTKKEDGAEKCFETNVVCKTAAEDKPFVED